MTYPLIRRRLSKGSALCISVALSIAATGTLPAQDADSALNKQTLDAVDDKPDIKILNQVEEARRLYDEGFIQFQDGNYGAAKKNVRKAFDILASVAMEEGLVEKIKPELDSLSEKIRSSEIPEIQISSSTSALEVSTEELLDVPLGSAQTEAPVKPNDVQNYSIKIDPDDKLAQKYLTFYTKGPRKHLVLKALEQSGRYKTMIEAALKDFGLPRELFYLVMVESEFKHNAYSRAGAAGLWQLMPATARKLGIKVSYWIDERYDPEKSTLAAMKYLRDLHNLFEDWHLALAAYNRGEFGIGKDLLFAKATQFSQLSQGAIPRETGDFVPKFMACVMLGDHPQDYGFFPRYEQPEPFEVVTLEKPLDLKIAAQCAGTSEEIMRRLNPAIRAWCTPINYPQFPLRIPKGTRERFLKEIAMVKDWNPARGFVRHKIRTGDALSRIARKYHTTVQAIVKDNKNVNAKRLKPGQVLNIQPGRKYFEKEK
ncbi:MAG: transglycosylase SLT domain-containing protein [Elusimicrobiota bacterium]